MSAENRAKAGERMRLAREAKAAAKAATPSGSSAAAVADQEDFETMPPAVQAKMRTVHTGTRQPGTGNDIQAVHVKRLDHVNFGWLVAEVGLEPPYRSVEEILEVPSPTGNGVGPDGGMWAIFDGKVEGLTASKKRVLMYCSKADLMARDMMERSKAKRYIEPGTRTITVDGVEIQESDDVRPDEIGRPVGVQTYGQLSRNTNEKDLDGMTAAQYTEWAKQGK